MISYQVSRSRRKTIALQVKHGQVFVRAPFHIDEQFIDAFIQKKEVWINTKINEQNNTTNDSCNFAQGSTLFLLGQRITLNIIFACDGSKTNTSLSEDVTGHQTLTVAFAKRNQSKLADNTCLAVAVKKQVECYFKEQAKKIILPKINYYAELTQLTPTAIKIRQYRARWGSCNNRHELSFNYLLMMLPIKVIDYVIVHELCHIEHLNHSSFFWQLVARHYPDYRQAKQWIKENQSALFWRQPI